MAIYRIRLQGEIVGVIVTKSKSAASAFAQGKYGPGAEAEKVDYKMALEADLVCEVCQTRMVRSANLTGYVRVLA